LLDELSTAMLDMPSNIRLSLLQEWLAIGDSLKIAADVHGTVALHNTSLAVADDPDFQRGCHNGTEALVNVDLFTGHRIYLLSPASTADQALIWLGLVPQVQTNSLKEECEHFALYAKRYDISRRACSGSWSVTRGGIDLLNGTCNATLPFLQQFVYQENTFFLGDSWLAILAESLGVFATQRNQSLWLEPAMATTVAAILWSSATGLNGPGNMLNQTPAMPYGEAYGREVTFEDVGLLYTLTGETVLSTRSTLMRSAWLYIILAIQPIAMVIMLIASAMLSKTPISKGFGVIALLAGVERESLDLLKGAEVSGELREDVKLRIVALDKSKPQEGGVAYIVERLEEKDGG
jgi:hypothetical protein